MIEVTDLYYKNKRFREYVDRYCAMHHLIVEDALKHKLVQSYAISIMPGGVNYIDDTMAM